MPEARLPVHLTLLAIALAALQAEAGPAAPVAAVYRETPIDSPNSRYYFSIRAAAEAAQFGWMLEAVAFEAFSSPAPGTVPVYCETPIAAEHTSYRLTTRPAALAEREGWKRLFVAFYAYAEPVPGAEAVYEESQSSPALGLQYNYAKRSVAEARQYAWTRCDIAFWVPAIIYPPPTGR